jgi:hypothetical protein
MMMFFNAFFFEAANPLIIQNTHTTTTCRFSVFFTQERNEYFTPLSLEAKDTSSQ